MSDTIQLGSLIEEIKIDALPPSSFGPGAELLMAKKKVQDVSVSVTDLDALERELNDLTDKKPAEFNIKIDKPIELKTDVKIDSKPSVKFDPIEVIRVEDKTKTWDGFKSFTTVDPDKEAAKPEMSKEDLLRNKFKYLRKLEELEAKGVTLTKKYSMESQLSEMQGEYETLIVEKERKNSMKFQGKMLMAVITGFEFLNSKFDPFDIKLDGWAEQVNENIDDYDDIFSELHEKYRSKATLAPELKLLFQLGGGAIMLHMTNTMFKSAIPGMDDIMRQNPDLMQKFTQAAVSSMAPSNPGFAGFMNAVQPPFVEKRPDMKGPSDISNILSGLKKTVKLDDEGSTVSLSELQEMQDGLKMPRKSKKKSDRNTLHL